jgi:hypothetical protein
MNSSKHFLFPFLGLLLFVGTVQTAQAQLELSVPGHFNHLTHGTSLGASNPFPETQFSSVGLTSGSAGPVGLTFPSGTTDDGQGTAVPSIQLRSARAGNAFATGVPRYYLGETILPPLLQVDNVTPAAANYWRSRPVSPGESFTPADLSNLPAGATQPLVPTVSILVTASSTDSLQVSVDSAPASLTPGATLLGQRVNLINGNIITLGGTANQNIATSTSVDFDPYQPFYYSPHADRVFASQAGTVQIIWVTATPDDGNWRFRKETFNVSGSAASEVRPMYWTEKSFNGPRVVIPGGQIDRVNPIYSANFPVATQREYVPVGSVDNPNPNSQPAEEQRTLWFEKFNGNGQLAAYNVEGRILVEYLGAELTSGRREFLGADVIEVSRQARVVDPVTVKLGQRVLPRDVASPAAADADTSLFASPVLNFAAGAELTFYGTQALPDARLVYWAERENVEANRVNFYWLEESDADIHFLAAGETPGLKIQWPLYLDRYLFIWPPSLDEYAHVVTDASGSSATTGLQFDAGSQPEIIYQDDGSQTQASFDPDTQRLVVTFDGSGDVTNRSLLKFNNGASLWYQLVYTQAQGRGATMNTNFAETVPITVPSTADLTVGTRVTGPGITGSATIVSIIDATHYELSQHVSRGTNDFNYFVGETLNLAADLSIVSGSTNPFYFSGGEWRVEGSATTATAILESKVLTVATTGAIFLDLTHTYFFHSYDDGGRLFVSRNGGAFTVVEFPDQIDFRLGRAWTYYNDVSTSRAIILPEVNAGDTFRFQLQASWDDSVVIASTNWNISAISAGPTFVLSSTSPQEVATVASTQELDVGMVVSGPGINGVVTIEKILSGTQIRLSQAIPEGTTTLAYAGDDPTAAIFDAAFVGTRIEPPSDNYSLAGAVVSGRSYQSAAYIDPYVSGVASAEAGAIIPVNVPSTLTNGIPDSQLTVRWFEEINPPAASTGFASFHVPSTVGRYNVHFRKEKFVWGSGILWSLGFQLPHSFPSECRDLRPRHAAVDARRGSELGVRRVSCSRVASGWPRACQ